MIMFLLQIKLLLFIRDNIKLNIDSIIFIIRKINIYFIIFIINTKIKYLFNKIKLFN